MIRRSISGCRDMHTTSPLSRIVKPGEHCVAITRASKEALAPHLHTLALAYLSQQANRDRAHEKCIITCSYRRRQALYTYSSAASATLSHLDSEPLYCLTAPSPEPTNTLSSGARTRLRAPFEHTGMLARYTWGCARKTQKTNVASAAGTNQQAQHRHIGKPIPKVTRWPTK